MNIVHKLEELRMWMERSHSEFTEDLDKICQELDNKQLHITDKDKVVLEVEREDIYKEKVGSCDLYIIKSRSYIQDQLKKAISGG